MPSAAADGSRSFVAPNPSPRAARLDQLGTTGRLALYQAAEFGRADIVTWAARYPEEIPTVNGEVEWIVLTSPTLTETASIARTQQPATLAPTAVPGAACS
jgi:hypothetical protein